MILNLRSIAVQSFLLLSFLMLSGCSKSDQVDGQVTAQAKTQAKTQVTAIANSTVQPSQIPKPLVTSQAVSTNLETSKLKNLRLQPVPPNGFHQLNEIGLKYFQGMGPLEYAVRLTGIPTTPAWRIRLRLYPSNEKLGRSYRVKVDHYNLSPALYRDVVSAYGRENADPSLNNTTPHQHIQMVFIPVMNVAANFEESSLQQSQSSVTQNPRDCGLGFGCADLFNEADDSQWVNEQKLNLVRAPWEQMPNNIYAMVRGLAEQSGKLQLNGDEMFWTDGEIPEGISSTRPWIEVLIDNYAGNGGGYQAHWIQRAADDSIRASAFRMYTDERMEGNAIASRSYVCSRGNVAGKLRTRCP
ncbi:hypothetical protein [Pseudanabaena sp. CCNP1317]|uniref:hypothetical protein n=1 Tax=Pseudanabaena sp. CCNP1317 TaxID=3110253 RepID=UPI002B206D24|nr:hypothetical protein [Pseudanabaena sp. CCNP1317]MEA5488852.1 hypothetical protein [Pseudanabaena sp. CCNP1317]